MPVDAVPAVSAARPHAPRRAAVTPRARRVRRTLAAALVALGVAPPCARAAEDSGALTDAASAGPAFTSRPRWELGVGGGVFSGHDYPASSDPNRRALALPFVIYRSPVFRVGGSGVRAVAVERPRVRLDLSLGASLSARSEGNGTRVGMPDLDFLFELGPQLEISLLDRPVGSAPPGRRGRLQLGAAAELRAVVATDFSGIGAQGFVAEAGLDVARRRLLGSRVDLIGGLGVTFADERLQDYFYEVEPRFATPVRPAYDARGGYLGTELSVALVLRPRPSLRLFVGVQSGLYAGAANTRSPLFETRGSTGLAVGFAWTFARSARLIDVIETD